MEQELRAARDKAALDAKAAQAETKTLKEQIAVLKDSTKVLYCAVLYCCGVL